MLNVLIDSNIREITESIKPSVNIANKFTALPKNFGNGERSPDEDVSSVMLLLKLSFAESTAMQIFRSSTNSASDSSDESEKCFDRSTEYAIPVKTSQQHQ